MFLRCNTLFYMFTSLFAFTCFLYIDCHYNIYNTVGYVCPSVYINYSSTNFKYIRIRTCIRVQNCSIQTTYVLAYWSTALFEFK